VKKGYGGRLLHRTGHGFGLGNHEGPWVAVGSDEVLKDKYDYPALKPGIYLPGSGVSGILTLCL